MKDTEMKAASKPVWISPTVLRKLERAARPKSKRFGAALADHFREKRQIKAAAK